MEINFFYNYSNKHHFRGKIRSMRTIELNVDRDVKSDYDVISFKVQTNDFLDIAVKSMIYMW